MIHWIYTTTFKGLIVSLGKWLGIGAEIAKPIEAVGDLYTTDKARLEATAKLTEAQTNLAEVTQKPQLALLETDRILAMSSNLFKSGFIPLSGWTAGFLLLVYYLPQLIVMHYVWAKHSIANGHCAPFPMRPDDLLHLVYVMCAGGVHSIFSKLTGKDK
jgi:hypothetical protein